MQYKFIDNLRICNHSILTLFTQNIIFCEVYTSAFMSLSADNL